MGHHKHLKGSSKKDKKEKPLSFEDEIAATMSAPIKPISASSKKNKKIPLTGYEETLIPSLRAYDFCQECKYILEDDLLHGPDTKAISILSGLWIVSVGLDKTERFRVMTDFMAILSVWIDEPFKLAPIIASIFEKPDPGFKTIAEKSHKRGFPDKHPAIKKREAVINYELEDLSKQQLRTLVCSTSTDVLSLNVRQLGIYCEAVIDWSYFSFDRQLDIKARMRLIGTRLSAVMARIQYNESRSISTLLANACDEASELLRQFEVRGFDSRTCVEIQTDSSTQFGETLVVKNGNVHRETVKIERDGPRSFPLRITRSDNENDLETQIGDSFIDDYRYVQQEITYPLDPIPSERLRRDCGIQYDYNDVRMLRISREETPGLYYIKSDERQSQKKRSKVHADASVMTDECEKAHSNRSFYRKPPHQSPDVSRYPDVTAALGYSFLDEPHDFNMG